MKESDSFGTGALNHLAKMRNQPLEELTEIAIFLCNERGLTEARVYQLLSEGYGRKKPHLSAFSEGDQMPGGKQIARHREHIHKHHH